MNDRTLRVLEFTKVVALLNNEAATVLGRKLTSKLAPLTNLTEVEGLQTATDEALHILRLNKTVPFSHITDIAPHIKRSVIGSVLETADCLEVAQTIYCGRNVKSFITNTEEDLPLLKAAVSEINPLRELENEINLKINEHGEIVDDASAKLKLIRSSIRSNETRVRERLNQLTRTKSKMLSDAIVTIRNNRYVLPVKQEYRSAIGGIVHDQSASGQTLFMEPRAVIEINNQLQHAVVKEKQEIDVILQGLTQDIAAYENDLMVNLSVIANVDFIFARGKLSVKMKAARPKLNQQGIIKLQQARHPLIPLESVVASDVSIGETYNAIVITGPNTGGKTVTLKMVGLLVLMAQSGLQIPAFDGCEVAVFKKVYADIGDEQSIEQNLSTFSSHMTNIVSIMDDVDAESLVLFDELGAGTDPQEGAALAMSILDDVLERKARVIATTHYPELKAYGYNRDNVMNASVEFDIETLKPTYRLLLGVPGKSNAFEISARLGLNTQIIEDAKSFIGIDSKNVENMISSLEETKQMAEQELQTANEKLTDSENIRMNLEKEWQQFEAKREKLYLDAEEKAKKAISKAREEAEIIVSEVRQMRDQTFWKEHEWIEAKKLLAEAQPDLVAKSTQKKQVAQDKTVLTIGDEIVHQSLNQSGEVISKLNDQEYIVQIGMMKINAKRKDLIYKKPEKVAADKKQYKGTKVVTSDRRVKTELDLRGTRYEDAMLRLEEYIDDCLVQGYARVSIIHGKGTGALRKGVEEYIKQHPFIKSHRLGAQNEGGSGITIVELN